MRKDEIRESIRERLVDYLEELKWDPCMTKGEVLEALVEYVIEIADEQGLPASSFDSLVNLTRMARAGEVRQTVDPKGTS